MVRFALGLIAAPGLPSERKAAEQNDAAAVRALATRKLSALAPGLTPAEEDRLSHHVAAALSAIVQAETARVRAALAVLALEAPEASRESILRPVREIVLPEAEIMATLCEMLAPEELLGLAGVPPSPELAQRMRRCPDLAVAAALTSDAAGRAIEGLLAHPSAQIREAAVDALLAQAGDDLGLRMPDCGRSALPPTCGRAIREVIAGRVLERLGDSIEIPRSLTAHLRQRLDERLQAEDTLHNVERESQQLLSATFRAGTRSQDAVAAALKAGHRGHAAALLARAAGVSPEIVDRAATLRSAKAIVSLAWKAGFSMKLTMALQAALASLPPGAAIQPAPDGGFPLSEREMRWQLEFLARGS